MSSFYFVIIFLCILSMIFLALDVGKNTVLNNHQILEFRRSFLFVALGAFCECFGVVFDVFGCNPPWIHSIITCAEYIITPFLTLLLAKSCGITRSIKPVSFIMGIHSLIEIGLLPFGLIISIDSSGAFVRGPFQWIYGIFCGISFLYILGVFIYLSKRNNTYSFITISIIAVVFLAGQVALIFDDQICTGYISICFTSILFYIYTQDFVRSDMLKTMRIEQEIANRDSLTGVSSRISFDRKVTELNELIKINPHSPQFAVCECDLNNLKLVNDSFGHEKGDEYLKNCCKSICNFFKHSAVYRIGGDEFAIILQNEDLRNLDEIKKSVFEFNLQQASKDADLYASFSFSAGFAVYSPEEDTSFASVLKHADFEMYANKKEIKKLFLERTK